MQPFPELKAKLTSAYDDLARRKQAIEALMESLKSTIEKMDLLLGDNDETITVSAGQIAPESAPAEPRIDFARLARVAEHPGSQFHRIAQFFVSRDNRPATVADLYQAIGASRSATTNILYRTQKEAFTSERVHGHPRLMAWRLHPDLYRRLSAEMHAEHEPSARTARTLLHESDEPEE